MPKLSNTEIADRAVRLCRLESAIEIENKALDVAKKKHRAVVEQHAAEIEKLRREILTGEAQEQLTLPTVAEALDHAADQAEPDFEGARRELEEMAAAMSDEGAELDIEPDGDEGEDAGYENPSEPYIAGFSAGMKGESKLSYDSTLSAEQRREWLNGWEDGTEEASSGDSTDPE